MIDVASNLFLLPTLLQRAYFKIEDFILLTDNVKIRVFHKKERRILDTIHFVTDRQLDKEFKIKDKQLVKILDDILYDYRESISQLGPKLDFFNVEELKNYLRDKDKEVDFIGFCTHHIESLRQAGRDGTYCGIRGRKKHQYLFRYFTAN